MELPEISSRVQLLVLGLIVFFLPVLFIVFTLAFLEFSGAVLLAELSALELFELYVIELVLFAVVIVGLYRLAMRIAVGGHVVETSQDGDEESADDEP
jgi:hypothetical protein